MEFRVLSYFLTVAKEENISKAAEALHITQPTLSRQLSELEEELGVQLLNRGKRKTTLTDAGLLLRKRAEEITSLTEKTKREFRQSDAIVNGDIYIGCGETNAMHRMALTAKKLQTDYPHIRYHLFSAKADDVTERLDKGLLDFGLLIEPANIRKYHSFELPDTDFWGLLMRRDSSLCCKTRITPHDLWDIPLLISQQSLDTHELYHWLQKEQGELNIISTYNLIFNASLMVEAGLGYALCLDKLVHTGPDSLLRFRPLQPQLPAHVYLIWKKQQLFSKAAALFLDKLKEQIDIHLRN
ncbi:LysR family transcriptional regulator [Pectinatus haikarae]|uniref:LysR family transcriptional regulator n=1 Tax=Pectinatus haikarae TaxID=349096 RepID=UPI0018C7CEA7|nr:LysR family transcriptional regulator [Pectinatus haikarae]